MRYTCLMILCITITLAALLSAIPPTTGREVANARKSYLITISFIFVLGILFEARLVRSRRNSQIRNYANHSESLECRVKCAQEMLSQGQSAALNHWHRNNVMRAFLDKYGEEMDRVQQVLGWEKIELDKSALQNFEFDGVEIEKGHGGRGLALVRLVRLLLDIRIELLIEHAKYIASLSEGYLKFSSTESMCWEYKRLEVHIEDFWARGWGHIINSRGISQDKLKLQRCFEGIPGSISLMAFVRREWATWGPWNGGNYVLGYEFQFAKVKKE
ncbi:hypothetical protein BKA61DRAFT_685948 [Leptodontidium sp. MPI-SDFR-AT-0119]|nr:hypothetical protein BKA61DRAFT_685948 [Leptodontidium sp. MPI-SDFR-AT-0119]